jgi:hypothetical protein
VLERIYIGRRFKNDTERLEKLFDLYTKMTAAAGRQGKKSGHHFDPDRKEGSHARMSDNNQVRTLRIRHLRPQRRIDQGQCAWHAAHAGTRL